MIDTSIDAVILLSEIRTKHRQWIDDIISMVQLVLVVKFSPVTLTRLKLL